MPTYEYACKQCGEHLDVVQRFTDDALTTCPTCSGSLRKVFGNIGISFKGSGFYKNDSRSSGNGAKKDNKDESSAKSEPAPASGDKGSSDGSESSKPSTDSKDSKGAKDPKGAKGSKESAGSSPPKAKTAAS